MRPTKNSTFGTGPSTAVSVIIFVLVTAMTAWVRLYVFADRTVILSWALPLLVCLFHPDRRLLWAMAITLGVLSAYKGFFLLPTPDAGQFDLLTSWLMQAGNIVIVAAAVHQVLNLTDRLRVSNRELRATNETLRARDDLITRQNEELQAQSEEMAQQNEELQQQSEELAQQNEEMQVQSEQLLSTNAELNQREAMLQSILGAFRETSDEGKLLTSICQSLVDLLQGAAAAGAVVEKVDDDLVLRAQARLEDLAEKSWPFDRSFAAIVMEQDRTAFVDDLDARPDLSVARPTGRRFRSTLATPLRLNGRPAGAVKVYSEVPRSWTTEDFRIIEWVAAQCSIILEAHRLREEVQRTNANLERLVAERTARQQELITELEHFSYSITHDMRAPLRAMQGFAGILAEECMDVLSEEHRMYLNRLMAATTRMDQLITDALNYSHAVRTELQLAPLDPAKLLRGMLDSYPAFQEPKARIKIEPGMPAVLANEAGLIQCFSNLLGNAVKFVKPGTTPDVTIRAEQHNGHVRLWFEDHGIGIPAEMKDRIFGMFQRASKEYEGTGIGLALVRKVSERMGGRVGVESEPGQGSRFWLELKAAPASSGGASQRNGQ
jgi:signal transduction histidine kinase